MRSHELIKGSLVNFTSESKLVSKRDLLILITFKVRLWKDPKPWFPSWLLSPAFIESENLTAVADLGGGAPPYGPKFPRFHAVFRKI